MTEIARLTISAAAAAYAKGDVPKEEKLKAARGELNFSPLDSAVLLVLLSRDANSEVRSAAVASLRTLPDDRLLIIATSPAMHPKVLDILARLHYSNPTVAALIASHPNVESGTRNFLAGKGVVAPDSVANEPSNSGAIDDFAGEDDVEEVGIPEEEEFRSKYQLAQVLGISEKIKFALTGDKEWRSIMIKDSNKLVSGAVLKNPRITDQEILAVAKSNMINEETVRVICNNKDWIKNYQIRKALVENNKTPLPFALRFLSTISEKDLSMIAKSKNVSTVIATQARKSLMVLQKRR